MVKDYSDVLSWPLEAYGEVLRGDITTSEDQVGWAVSPDVARQMCAAWNLYLNVHKLGLGQLVYGTIAEIEEALESNANI